MAVAREPSGSPATTRHDALLGEVGVQRLEHVEEGDGDAVDRGRLEDHGHRPRLAASAVSRIASWVGWALPV